MKNLILVGLLALATQVVAQPLPPTPAPNMIPPAPGDSVDGQWVHTMQYGWLWMPYGEQFIRVETETNPRMYVYYPSMGWSWVFAPWVMGYGVEPFYGSYGHKRYVWYGGGYGYYPGYRQNPYYGDNRSRHNSNPYGDNRYRQTPSYNNHAPYGNDHGARNGAYSHQEFPRGTSRPSSGGHR